MKPLPATVLKEFAVTLPNRPGSLGAFDIALGRAGVDVLGYLLASERDTGMLRFVVDDPARAEAWMQATGHGARVREVLAVPGEHKPGFLGGLAERLGAAGVNIEASYPATIGGRGHVVFAVDDLAAARKVLG